MAEGRENQGKPTDKIRNRRVPQSQRDYNASYEATNKRRGLVRISLWVPAEDAGEMEEIAKRRRITAGMTIKKDQQ